MPHLPAELNPDRSGIGVMAICRDPVRRDAGHHLGRSKECLGGRQIAVLAQHDVDQGTVAIDRAIEIPPLAPHSDVSLSRDRLAQLLTKPCGVASVTTRTAEIHSFTSPLGYNRSIRRSERGRFLTTQQRRFRRTGRAHKDIEPVMTSSSEHERPTDCICDIIVAARPMGYRHLAGAAGSTLELLELHA